jgi:hypothetical protein
MLKYYPYKSDKSGKKYYILLPMIIKRFILARPPPLILPFMKRNKGYKDILIDTRIMKLGQNLAKIIPQGSGLVGCYGIFQPKR